MSPVSEQERTPLLDAIRQYREADPAYFCIPGHRFERGADDSALRVLGALAYASDLTETDGMDDLHIPRGVIAQAQSLAADVWGATQTFFLVNGSTSGNEAMFLATLRPGEKVLLPRDVHTSVLSALILTGADPIWIVPPTLAPWTFPAPIWRSP